jgi:SPP1 family phage portal protein
MKENDVAKIYSLLTSKKKPFSVPYEECEAQYHPSMHKVMSPFYRKKKVVKVKTGKNDLITGAPIYKEKKVERVRVAVPVQRVIVERSVGFLFSNKVEYRSKSLLNEQQTQTFDAVMNLFDDNKIGYFDKKLARTLFKERECAELWYFTLNGQGKPKDMHVKLLSPSNGDSLYPHFDDYDRMDGFARKYAITDENNRTTTHFDVYTDKFVYRYINDGNGMKLLEQPKQHGFTKIPIVYYRQDETEWNPVQPVIERVEELLSNWGDTNDYFGSPSYFFKGKLSGFAEKGEQGKVYQGEGEGADMKVLSWDSSPASITGELANLFNIIFSYTQTPDISFENMKTLGGNTSGVAIKLMFTDPHMKAEVKIELFGEMFTRRYNIVQNGYVTSLVTVPDSVVNGIRVEPVFKPYMPKNELEEIQIISTSTGGKATMSQEEGVKQNPRVSNAEEVLKQIQAEEAAQMMNDAFGMAE